MDSGIFYRSILAIHIIAVMSWVAGLLYLYRLFVYHAMETENVVKERFTLMEGKCYRIIIVPAMLASLAAGIGMITLQPTLLSQHWLHLKLLMVVLLIGVSHMGKRFHRKLTEGSNQTTHKAFRVWNEVPTLLMIIIVFLVILRPF